MSDVPLSYLFLALLALILLSAFFSSSETGMMSLNRYRLRHQANEGVTAAKKAQKLLDMPERLIGVILIGNNLMNNAAAVLAAMIAIRLLPGQQDLAASVSTVVLTLVMLVFAEVTPKTLAQRHPERIAYPSSYILQPLLKILAPVVWLVNIVVQAVLWLLRANRNSGNGDALSTEELRTLVQESGNSLAAKRQNMLLGILDLDNVTVEDIMIPRNEVEGIDLDLSIEAITERLNRSNYTRLPIYKGDLDKVIGILHIRDAAEFLMSDKPSKVMLSRKAKEAYFVPESTPLQTQLINFQREKLRMGLAVDEYGDIQGLVTLEDILEEIVGEFTTDLQDDVKEIHPQRDGSYVIDGTASLRDINKALEWDLPVTEAKTLSGLIIETLEDIPDANSSLKIGSYLIEILQINKRMVIAARLNKLED